jgi:hypothetical protein
VRDNVTDAYLTQNMPNPFFGILPRTTTIGASANIARERLLRPYPQFDQVFSTTNDGYSWYHSLQVRLEKRFSKGYTFLAAYTYSKFMQATQYMNQDDLRPRSVSVRTFLTDIAQRNLRIAVWEGQASSERRKFCGRKDCPGGSSQASIRIRAGRSEGLMEEPTAGRITTCLAQD